MNQIDKDVLDVRMAARARQAAEMDSIDVEIEELDITVKVRGHGAAYDASLEAIAESIGLGDTSNPSQNAHKIYKRAIEKFQNRYFIMLMINKGLALGLMPDEAESFASRTFEHCASRGIVSDMLRRVIEND